MPFEIPDSWEWIKLGYISTYEQTKAKIKSSQADPNTWELNLEDIEKGGRLLQKKSVKECKSKGDKTIFHVGDILYSKLRPYLLKIMIADEDGICTSEIVPFRLYGDIYSKYVVYTLKSPFIDGYINSVTYGVKMPRAGTDTMINLYLPLPPLSEQHRIVAKLQELEPLIEKYRIAEEQLHELNSNIKDQLKKSILQYAIEGKLVPQDPNDEPASVLLERIREEKQQLIKEGKIKKDKNESIIFRRDNSYYEKFDENTVCIDEIIPFEIANGWRWTRLGCILTKLTDGTHATPKYISNGIPFLSVKDISSGFIDFSKCKFISINEHNELYKRCDPKKNDILLTKVGTTGIPVVVNTKTQFSLFVSVALLKFNHKYINVEYLKLLLDSPLVQIQCKRDTKGVGNKNWVIRDIYKTLVVLPPLVEQKKIVTALNEIYSILDC